MDRIAEDLMPRLQALFAGKVTGCCETGCCPGETECCKVGDPACCAG